MGPMAHIYYLKKQSVYSHVYMYDIHVRKLKNKKLICAVNASNAEFHWFKTKRDRTDHSQTFQKIFLTKEMHIHYIHV